MKNFDILGGCPYCMSNPHLPGCPNAPDEVTPLCFCSICGGAIYENETIYKVDGAPYHVECFEDEFKCRS